MSDAPALFPLGPDGILLRFSDRLSDAGNRAALAFRAAFDEAKAEGVVETATSLTSVFIRFRPDRTDRASVVTAARAVLGRGDWTDARLPEGRTLWTLPAVFGGEDGPDLDEVADLAGLPPAEAVESLCSAHHRVLALGFAPGQPYLGFLPENWNIPRRTEVTPRVPRGAVVVAVRQVIPFANAAPTGWRQVGRTAFRCHDPDAEPPLPLRAGDKVRFTPVSPGAFARLETERFGGATREALE